MTVAHQVTLASHGHLPQLEVSTHSLGHLICVHLSYTSDNKATRDTSFCQSITIHAYNMLFWYTTHRATKLMP